MLQEHRSRPLWARELKLWILSGFCPKMMSRPLWARELKLLLFVCIIIHAGRAPCGRVN